MLNLLILILILLIVFVQAMYGFFNALIMAVCTLVCTLLAFSYYEPLAGVLAQWQPTMAHAGALIALLGVPLIAMRFLVDNFLPGNVVSAVWVDRVGGGLLGFFTALLLVGTLVIAGWMLPTSRDFLGTDSYANDLTPADGLLIDAPGFTLGLVEKLSAGSMGGRSFTDTHGDLLLELWGIRNRPEGATTMAMSDSAKLLGLYDVTELPYPGAAKGASFKLMAPDYPNLDKNTSKVYIARVKIDINARDRDRWWRLPLTHFRMTTSDGGSFFPVGYMVRAGDWNVVTGEIGEMVLARQSDEGQALTADLLFRVPAGGTVQATLPQTVRFRRIAVMTAPKTMATEMPDPEIALMLKEVYDRVKVIKASAGIASEVKPTEAFLNAELPAPFSFSHAQVQDHFSFEQRSGDASVEGEFDRGKLKRGEIRGIVSALDTLGGNSQTNSMFVDELFVDEDMKVVKLLCEPLVSDAFLGDLTRGLQFQPMIRMAGGDDIHAVGAWVNWREGGKDNCYYSYRDRPDESQLMTNRTDPGILKVLDTYREKRKTVTQFGLIFVTPDKGRVVGFLLGGSERYNCESPLSVERAPRRRRR